MIDVERREGPKFLWPEWPDEAAIERTARKSTETLQKLPLPSPKEAENHPTTVATRKFLKQVSGRYPNNPEIQKCRKAFLAFQLGIPLKALDNTINPGFEAFARKHHLERPLIIFDHRLMVANEGKLSIFFQREFQPWESVREIALTETPEPTSALPELYNPPLKYAAEGICNRNYYNWTELKPFKQEKNHPWGNRYLLEICCLCSGHFRLFGDHTWIRLKTPEGDIYSAGLYRETNLFRIGWRKHRGKLQSPDISEFWKEKIHTVAFQITEDDFSNIKIRLESDQRENRLQFHVLKQNCTTYALELAKIAKIHIDIPESFTSHFIPKQIQNQTQALNRSLPAVTALTHHVACIILNFAQFALGASKLSPNFSDQEKTTTKPHMTNILDVFDASKLDCDSPYKIAFILIDQVMRAREEEAQKQRKSIEEFDYWVPDVYKIAPTRDIYDK